MHELQLFPSVAVDVLFFVNSSSVDAKALYGERVDVFRQTDPGSESTKNKFRFFLIF